MIDIKDLAWRLERYREELTRRWSNPDFANDAKDNYDLWKEKKQDLDHKIKATGAILDIFPESKEYNSCLEAIVDLLPEKENSIANYLFQEIKQNDNFIVSQQAFDLKTKFVSFLKTKEFP